MKNLLTTLIASVFAIAVAAQTSETHYAKYLTTSDFREKVVDYTTANGQWIYKGERPCVIDFYATWCGPCKMIAPILEDLAKEYDGQVDIYKVDTDKEKELAALFGIRSIPTLLFVPQNALPQIAQGALPRETLVQIIDTILLGKKAQPVTN